MELGIFLHRVDRGSHGWLKVRSCPEPLSASVRSIYAKNLFGRIKTFAHFISFFFSFYIILCYPLSRQGVLFCSLALSRSVYGTYKPSGQTYEFDDDPTIVEVPIPLLFNKIFDLSLSLMSHFSRTTVMLQVKQGDLNFFQSTSNHFFLFYSNPPIKQLEYFVHTRTILLSRHYDSRIGYYS